MINNHQPLCCPKCLSTKIEFLTESHKAIIERIIYSILNGVIYLIALLAIIETIKYAKISNAIVGIVFLMIIQFFIKVSIIRQESKTHIQIICRNCGNYWLHN